MLNSISGQWWRGFDGVLTDRRFWSRIEVFLIGAGECDNTPLHLNSVTRDVRVVGDSTQYGNTGTG